MLGLVLAREIDCGLWKAGCEVCFCPDFNKDFFKKVILKSAIHLLV